VGEAGIPHQGAVAEYPEIAALAQIAALARHRLSRG
jgi:hypothetical protein